MSVVERLLVDPASGSLVVWGGRRQVDTPGSLDGWSTDRATLLTTLDGASELVVLDPMSFPWESLRPADRSIPLVVVLPSELDGPALEQVLGRPLLTHLAAADRLVEPRADVRRALSEAWRIGDGQWLDSPDRAADDAPDRARKAVWQTVRSALATAVGTHLDESGIDLTRLTVVGDDPSLARALSCDLGRQVLAVDPDDDTTPDPLDQAVLAVQPQGGTREVRTARLHRAHRRLRSGGLFVLVATVVAVPGDEPGTVPSMDDLVEELQQATGLGLHVHEIRSLRWAGEPMLRGALLAGTSLAPAPRGER
jgi:hypothetical protein